MRNSRSYEKSTHLFKELSTRKVIFQIESQSQLFLCKTLIFKIGSNLFIFCDLHLPLIKKRGRMHIQSVQIDLDFFAVHTYILKEYLALLQKYWRKTNKIPFFVTF